MTSRGPELPSLSQRCPVNTSFPPPCPCRTPGAPEPCRKRQRTQQQPRRSTQKEHVQLQPLRMFLHHDSPAPAARRECRIVIAGIVVAIALNADVAKIPEGDDAEHAQCCSWEHERQRERAADVRSTVLRLGGGDGRPEGGDPLMHGHAAGVRVFGESEMTRPLGLGTGTGMGMGMCG
jgi:hypothetical protein